MAKKPTDNDVAFVKALAQVLQDNDLTELEVKREYGEDDCLNVRVSRQVNVIQSAPAPVTHSHGVAPIAPAVTAPAPDSAAMAGGDDPAQHPGAVTSPMVGTCYLQAEPGSPAFVNVGDQVEEGQTLLIVEAMKTMNQIPAPRAGTIKRVLVEDGTPVEFGAPLMIIE